MERGVRMSGFRRQKGRLFHGDEWWLVPPRNTHEDWFTHTEWIAEFWCTVTMLPLALAALVHCTRHPVASALALCASVASAVSHAYPSRRMLTVDKTSAVALVLWMAQYLNGDQWFWFALAPLIGLLDVVARRFAWPVPGLHPAWHITAALCVHKILSGQ